MGRHKGLTQEAFQELWKRYDRPRTARERACQRLNEDLARAIDDRENKAWAGDSTEYAPIVLGPDSKRDKRLVGTLACAEEGRNVGASWRRLVEVGTQLESNPRTLGRYATPETAIVSSPAGVVTPRYRNQGGDPLRDAIGTRKTVHGRVYRERIKSVRKAVAEMTALPATDVTGALLANERAHGDVGRYFRG